MGQHNNEPTMTRLEELQLQRELKQVLLEYVNTIYTPTHSSALLVCRHTCTLPSAPGSRGNRRGREEFIMIRAIVYLNAEKSKWKIVTDSSKAQFGILPALQEFSKDLEREMGRMGEKSGEKRKAKSGIYGEDDVVEEGEVDGKRMRM